MQALISVFQSQIGDTKVNAVDARDLHQFLQVGKVFGAWIEDRIAKYGFVLDQDYLVSEIGIQVPHQGGIRNTTCKEYFISIDMAKELAMVERNDRGKQARQYFIECERRAKALAVPVPAGLPDFTNPTIAARAWADERERGDLNELALREVQAAITSAEPKLKALETIAGCDGSMCITNAAKALQVQPKAFFRWLSEHQWIYRRTGGSSWIAYQERIQSGLLEHKITTVERSDGSQKVVEQVLVTAKGLTRLAELLTSLRTLQPEPPADEVAR